MPSILNKQFAPNSKEVKYIGKDFNQLKQNLIEFAKQYYPKTYKDFNPSSPGMMFIEMTSYVGDVLAFYLDYQFKEGLFNYAEERKNVISLASYLGYSPKPSKPAVGTLDIYQLVPAIYSGSGAYVPDTRYGLKIKEGMQVLSSNKMTFITTTDVDFSINTLLSPREDAVFSTDPNTNEPTFYLLKKNVPIYSGKITTQTFNVVGQTPFLKLTLNESNVIKIISVVDSNNNTWNQVDYMAQDLVMLPVENNVLNFPTFSQYNNTVPNVVKFLRTNKRFVVSVDENNLTSLQFGASTDSVNDEILIPNSDTLGQSFSGISKYNLTLDSTAFLKTSTYGTSPSNTTLTVTYIIGGGIDSNTNVGDINIISSITFDDRSDYLPTEQSLVNTVKNSIKVNNPDPAIGGQDSESVYEIKQNAIANFAAQNRIVTSDDYITKVYTMPPQYGSVSKVFVASESGLSINNISSIKGLLDSNNNLIIDDTTKNFRKVNLDAMNQFGINLYTLAYDQNKNLKPCNSALTYNLKNYLAQFRIMSDRINIIDGYVINIGVNFTILTYSTYNKKEVLNNCIAAVQEFFNIDTWQFSQPINLSQLELQIAQVQGVQSIPNLEIVNLVTVDGSGEDYSIYEYDINAATNNKIIYPPIDPAIFEVKYPNTDIRGRTA